MTLTMGSEVAGSTLPFEVSLAFWPARLGCARRLRRTVPALGWPTGSSPQRQAQSPFPGALPAGDTCASGNGDYTSVLMARGFGKLSRRRPWRLTV